MIKNQANVQNEAPQVIGCIFDPPDIHKLQLRQMQQIPKLFKLNRKYWRTEGPTYKRFTFSPFVPQKISQPYSHKCCGFATMQATEESEGVFLPIYIWLVSTLTRYSCPNLVRPKMEELISRPFVG